MKLYLVLLTLFFASNSNSQIRKTLLLTDSIKITSGLLSSQILDIAFVNNQFWARFDSWQSDGIYINLVSNQIVSYIFHTKDSSISSELTQLLPFENGFLFPKYSGSSKLLYFDTSHSTIAPIPFKSKSNSYILYPNTEALFRNSIGYKHPNLIFNRLSIDVNNRSKKSLARTLKRRFDKERLFVLYNMETGAEVSFGSYPEIYNRKRFLIGNMQYFFSLNQYDEFLYVSYQATDVVDVYNIYNGRKYTIENIKGLYIDEHKLSTTYGNPSDFTNKEYLSLLSDSYGEISCYQNGFLRIYKKGFESFDLKSITPAEDAEFCPSPALRIKWMEKQLEKTTYLQRIENDTVKVDAIVPKFVNQLISYNEATDEYYFWKKTLKVSDGSATVYVFKTQ